MVRAGDMVILGSWATGLTVRPGVYVVDGVDDDGATMRPAGEDEDGEIVPAGAPVHVPSMELGYFKTVAGS